jgi:hypothetical protein
MRPMSDKSTGQLKAFALALILVGMVGLPLVRGFQTGFAPAVEVIDNVPHPVPHVKVKPSGSPEHDKRKPGKPGKPERNDDD